MILGGLSYGVTPLEMAHAYNSIAADGQRISGTLAADAGGPVGIQEVTDGEGFKEGEPVEDQSGASGVNKVSPSRWSTRPSPRPPATCSRPWSAPAPASAPRPGSRPGARPGTTDDNGDAWFCGATEQITACVWVGHAESNTPMLTEYAGAPVDGGTIPAEIFASVVNEFEELQAARKAGEDTSEDATVDGAGRPTRRAGADRGGRARRRPRPRPPRPSRPSRAAPAAPPRGAAPAPSTSGGGVSPG